MSAKGLIVVLMHVFFLSVRFLIEGRIQTNVFVESAIVRCKQRWAVGIDVSLFR